MDYDPTTGQTKPQTITHVFVNHDTDRLDVTLALPAKNNVQPPTAAQDATTAREQRALVMNHGRRGPPDASATPTTSATTATATDEVIHTTANHPWLSADRGWQLAGGLRVGEPVRLLDGGTATVVALHALPGVGSMWDLSLDATHTFAVGNVQAVVHNCTNPLLDQEASQAHDRIKFGSQPEHPFTAAVADIRLASGEEVHVAALNQHAWTESQIDDTVLKWATEGLTGKATKILDDPALLNGVTKQAAGHAHAEEYIAGYMANNPGSRLLGIGTSTPPCPACAAIIGGLPQ